MKSLDYIEYEYCEAQTMVPVHFWMPACVS